MMETMDIDQAETHLRPLLDHVAKGGSFVITEAGQPIAKIIPISGAKHKTAKRLGFMQGWIRVPADFDRMGEAEIDGLFSHRP